MHVKVLLKGETFLKNQQNSYFLKNIYRFGLKYVKNSGRDTLFFHEQPGLDLSP